MCIRDSPKNPWPNWPRTLKTTSSHEEGCTRRWNINSLEFLGKNGIDTFLNEYGYLYDYVDGNMMDWSVRPNMIFAVAFDISTL